MGSEYEGVWGLILEGWKYSGIIQWWWLYDLMNILKTTEKVDFMVWELHLNFFFFNFSLDTVEEFSLTLLGSLAGPEK